jgi:hypothetical protein
VCVIDYDGTVRVRFRYGSDKLRVGSDTGRVCSGLFGSVRVRFGYGSGLFRYGSGTVRLRFWSNE